MVCCSVRSSRRRERESSGNQPTEVVASSSEAVPQRQFYTSVECSDVQPAATVSEDVNHTMRRYSGADHRDFRVSSGGPQVGIH